MVVEHLRVPGFVDLRHLSFGPEGSVVVREADLSRALMLGTDVSRITFQAVDWPDCSVAGSTRRVVADELHWPPPDSPGLVFGNLEYGPSTRGMLEVLYRQLKNNYDQQADYETAGHFHIGEFEAKRLKLKRWTLNRCLVSGYRWVSLYGERWARPLIILLVWLVFFAIAELFAGVSLSSHRIAYSLTGAGGLGSFWHDLGVTFLHGVQVATAFRTPDIGYGSIYTLAIVTARHIIGPALIALFLLGLRRQLKR